MCSLFTGTYGRRGCTANCVGCYTGMFEKRYSMYQGNVGQIYELLSVLPNLKRIFIFGNPDPSVDYEFCNVAGRIFQSRDIEVLFVSNGVGGIETVKRIIDGLDTSLIRGFGISIDSLDEKKNSAMKGIHISLDDAFQSIKYLKNLNIDVKIFTTVWPMNEDEDWKEFVEFFETRGIYTVIRFGHVEGVQGRVSHVSERKILEIRGKYEDIRLATILANDEEYENYLSTYVAQKKFRCTNFDNISVFFTDGEIKATYSCPIISHIYPEYLVNIRDLKLHSFYENLIKNGICPVSGQALGFKSETLHSVCRFYKKLSKNKNLASNKVF